MAKGLILAIGPSSKESPAKESPKPEASSPKSHSNMYPMAKSDNDEDDSSFLHEAYGALRDGDEESFVTAMKSYVQACMQGS